MDRAASSQGRLHAAWGLPEGGVAINERVWYRDDGHVRAIFYGMLPFYSYDRSDKVNHKFAAVQLIEAGLARQNDVAAAFGLSVSTLCRARQVVAREGLAGLVGKPKGPTGRRKAARGVANRIVALRKKGKSHRAIADRLGISPSTVNRVLRERGLTRRVAEPTGTLPFEGDQPTDVDSEGESSSGVAESLTVDLHSEVEATSIAYASPLAQFAARLGLIEEAPVEFAPARDVPMAGVLLGVALLSTTGLGEVTDGDPVKLTYERKLLTDTIKMCAYDVETQLTEMLAGVLRRQDFEGRAVIRELFQTPGDLSLSNGRLHVYFNQLSAPRYTTALMSLCQQLNARDLPVPETSFTLRFHVKPRPENGQK